MTLKSGVSGAPGHRWILVETRHALFSTESVGCCVIERL